MNFDIVIVSDFRFPGGTSTAVAHEVRALHAAGYTVGLLQKRAAVLRRFRDFHPEITTCLDAGQATLIDAGSLRREVVCRLAILHNPYVFTERDPDLPRIQAGQTILVAQHPITSAQGAPYYDVWGVQRVAAALAGPVIWAPISPLSRRSMQESRLPFVILDEDWSHVFFLDDWASGPRAPPGFRPSIGRHSRPDREKWPATREDVLRIYPDGDEFDVRLLGVGPALEALMGGPLPASWTTYEFGEIAPDAFLSNLDFFVYFHHPAWVEGFGRAIAEAAASGAVVILPEYLRITFGDAALYREPADVLATVRALSADSVAYTVQSRIGRAAVERLYGPDRFLRRIRRLLGEAERVDGASPARSGPAPVRAKIPSAPRVLDVLHVGDFRTRRDAAWQIANLVEIEAERGYAAGLLHIGADDWAEAGAAEDAIHPILDELARRGRAAPIHPYEPEIRAKLAVIHAPTLLAPDRAGRQLSFRPSIVAGQWAAILDRAVDPRRLTALDAFLRTFFNADIAWAATDPKSLAALQQAGVRAEAELWSPAVAPAGPMAPRRPHRDKPVLGFMCMGTPPDPAEAAARIARLLFLLDGNATLRLLDPPFVPGMAADLWGENVELFDGYEMSPFKFIAELDFFVALPSGASHPLPAETIAWAMAHGVPAVLPHSYKARIGDGPIYARRSEIAPLTGALQADEQRMNDIRAEMVRLAARRFSPAPHDARLRLAGLPPRTAAKPEPQSRTSRRRVLFLSTNGVGLGHLTRLLAIARRLPNHIEPVFATMSQAISIVEQAGYPVEYLPFHVYANCDSRDWNVWLAEQLGQIIEFHAAAAVVFDGTMPYGGLLNAVGPRSDVKSVWIRRGMWQESQDNSAAIARERFFSVVIEPTDIAESMDRGATAARRSRALSVGPIRLLDAGELHSRKTAAERLGLDPSRPAVLIQLGSGWNRDQAAMTDAILGAIVERPGVQPVLVEWLISNTELGLWPNVPRLKGFPVTKYYNAFDCTISACGYNSFNEIISFALPAIFVPNSQGMMDDQLGRAMFAAEQGAAQLISGDGIGAIGPLLDLALDGDSSRAMRASCRRLARENGADAAAAAIAGLVE